MKNAQQTHYEQQWPKIGQGRSSSQVKLTQHRIYKNTNEIILVPRDPTATQSMQVFTAAD